MSDTLKADPLTWSGYSQPKRVTLYHYAPELAEPISLYETLPFCSESYKLLSAMDSAERISLHERVLEGIDHSTNLTPYLGIIEKDRAEFVHKQLELSTLSMIRLLKILAKDNCKGAEFEQICASMSPELALRFRSAMETSRHNYTQFNDANLFKNNLQQPLYLETAVDIMMNGLDMILAEFQVRYSAPYPHLLRNLNRAYKENFPDLFERFNLLTDEFPARRGRMMSDACKMFEEAFGGRAARIVIDGWAYLRNSGANWKDLARELKAGYIIFDDLRRGEHQYDRHYGYVDPIFIFNQAPVHQLDPYSPIFRCINDERMENYDELAWDGLTERYLDGEVLFAHPPITDLLNDKALYDFIPELCRIFFDTTLQLPVVQSLPFWSGDDPNEVNDVAIAKALRAKDECVIAHRYLEGGSGIRIGPAMSWEDWNKFVGDYVVERPYLYVLRDFFPMDPDISLRIVTSSLTPSMQIDAPVEFTCADTFLLRFSAQKPLTLRNSRCFLVFQSLA